MASTWKKRLEAEERNEEKEPLEIGRAEELDFDPDVSLRKLNRFAKRTVSADVKRRLRKPAR